MNTKYTLLLSIPLLLAGCRNGHERESVVQRISGKMIIAKDVNTGTDKIFDFSTAHPTVYHEHKHNKRTIDVSDLQYIQPNDTVSISRCLLFKYKHNIEFTISQMGSKLWCNSDSLIARRQRKQLQDRMNQHSR